MSKTSKKDYEETLNELFGTSIKWSKLSMAELEELARALTDNRDRLCDKLQCISIPRIIDLIVPPEHQGPVLKALKKLASEGIGRQ